jgi:Relaxase/Mobilisation nuclease domain.
VILKTLSRKSNTGQLVQYIFRYIFKEEKKNLESSKDKPFILRHNIRSRSLKGFIREFRENESFRLVHRKDSVKLFHTILSFSNKDKEHITDKMLKDLFKKFVAERGSNCLYAGTKHFDKDHIHLHISVSGTQLNGRSSRVTKQKLHHIKIELDKYQKQKYPQLVNSLPEHGKGKKISKEDVLQTIKAERQTGKETLMSAVEKTFATSKSKYHFLSQLIKIGLEPYYRNGRLQGLKYQRKKFRLGRLGFDESKLKSLDKVKSLEDDELTLLNCLRTNGNRELRKDFLESTIEKEPTSIVDKNYQVLDELSNIRNQGNQIIHDDEHRVRSFGEEYKINGGENVGTMMPALETFTNLIKPTILET